MTFMSMPHLGGGNKHMANLSGNGIGKHSRRRPGAINIGPVETSQKSAEQAAAAEIELMVSEGRQKDITQFFDKWKEVPKRVGDWDIRVNIRRIDNEPVSRTVVALPLTVRARTIFEKGCLATLKKAGYSDEDAARYYKAAWKKKYVWVDSVISAIKEMIDSFQNDLVLSSYEAAGDPRRLASNTGVPRNPYLVSHAHFLVAVEMAKCIINSRQAGEEVKAPKDKSQPNTSNMVMA
jgi:hypothetical protein